MATKHEDSTIEMNARIASILRDITEVEQRRTQTKLEFPKFLVTSIIAAVGAGVAIGGLLVNALAN